MLPLVYIDNSEKEDPAEVRRIQRFLEKNGIDPVFASKHQAFYRMEEEEAGRLLFSKENALITWSVYANDCGIDSERQFLEFMFSAYYNDVRDKVYIDASGVLLETLNSWIDSQNTQYVKQVLSTIERNFIMTRGEDSKAYRIRTDFRREPFDLLQMDLKTILSFRQP